MVSQVIRERSQSQYRKPSYLRESHSQRRTPRAFARSTRSVFEHCAAGRHWLVRPRSRKIAALTVNGVERLDEALALLDAALKLTASFASWADLSRRMI